MRSKPNPKEKGVSYLDARRNALSELQAKLDLEIERHQKVIAEAPRLAEQAAKLRREELVQRKARSEARFGSPRALPDPRYLEVTATRPERRLRKDRNQGMVTFFLLCIVLVLVVFWLYNRVIQGG